MKRAIAIATVVAGFVGLSTPPVATAGDFQYAIIKYHVDVKYRYSNTNYYRWRTELSTTNRNLALNFYDVLWTFKQDGTLNEMLTGGSEKWIAVDVRLRWTAETYSSGGYRRAAWSGYSIGPINP